MANLNKCFIIGRCSTDVNLRYTPSGTAVAELGLAVNRKFKQGDDWKEDVTFIDVTVWGKSAENCAEYLKKGSQAFIEGRLKLDQWEQDGKKRSKLGVIAENVQFLGDRGASQRDERQQPYNHQKPSDFPSFDDNTPF